MPLLRETMTLIPVSTNGTEKSTTSDLSSLIVSEPMAMSARLYTTWKGQQQQWERNLIMANSCNCSQQTKPIFHSPPPFFPQVRPCILTLCTAKHEGSECFSAVQLLNMRFLCISLAYRMSGGPSPLCHHQGKPENRCVCWLYKRNVNLL